MKYHLYISSLILLAILLTPTLLIADVQVRADVDRTQIHENERVVFTIEITGNASSIPEIVLPNLPGFESYSSGTTQNYSIVNGRTSVSKSYSFSLLPTRAGKLSIPRLTIEIDGKEYNTKRIDITVKQGTSRSNLRNSNTRQGRSRSNQSPTRQLDADDLFIATSVSKDTVYVNEQVTLSFKFYQAEGVDVMQNPDYQPPRKTGFWVEDLPPRKTGYKVLKNRRYHVTEIFTGLFPTNSGEQTIGEAKLTLMVREPRRNDPFSVFDNNFFGLSGRGRTASLKSDPISIVTLPLPKEGQPEDFGGAVGKYTIKTWVDNKKVEVNEPITLQLRISGTGNIKSIASPEIPELSDFRTYQSGDSENTTKTNYRIAGSKTFEHVFIPKRAGTYLLPAVSFSFFNPEMKQYQTVSSESIQLEITPAKERYVSQMQNLEANNINLVAKDIRYLKPEIGNLNGQVSHLLALKPFFWSIYLIPILGYLIVVGQKRRQEKLRTDVTFRRLKQAKKMAEKRLAKAKKHLEAGDPNLFYSETSSSMIEYFGDRFNLPAFGLTAEKIKDYAIGELDNSLTAKLLGLLEKCDFGRFASGGTEQTQMDQLWRDAKNLIIELEKTR